jgi:hypothetical protein
MNQRLILRSNYSQKAAAHVYAPHMATGKGLVSGFTFNFDTETHGTISHVNRFVQISGSVLT